MSTQRQTDRPARRDLRVVHGEATRKRILETAMDVASTDGLEALTIGRLATDLGMSKAGLFGHFGSKEALQLATLDAAHEVFVVKVVMPAMNSEPGLPRLRAMVESWLRYIEEKTFRGGCIFASATAEFDGRQGPVRDRVASIVCEWMSGLEGIIAEAKELGHLPAALDGKQLAFELNALMLGGNWGFQLFGEEGAALEHARRAVEARLAVVAAPASAEESQLDAGQQAPDALETPDGGKGARRHRKGAR